MTLIVLHHTDDVGLGTLADPLAARGSEPRHVDVGTVDAIDLDGVTGILLLGGRPATPFPEPELQAVRDAVASEVPLFGICHGAEVLASALGGEVAQREKPEAAYVALHRTEPGRQDDVTAGWPDGSRALALHRHEVVRLPTDADQLLIGSDGPSLWRAGSAWATQLHVEADGDLVAAWMAAEEGQALARDAGVDPDELVREARHRERYARAVGTSLVMRWLDGIVTA